jgi:hypothetical protein
MRHLAIIIAMLSVAVCTNAANLITVNGVIGPDAVSIDVNGSLNIGIANDFHAIEGQGSYFLGIALGGYAHFEINNPIFPYPFMIEEVGWVNDAETANLLGIYNPFVGVTVMELPPYPPTLLEKRLVDGIVLNCDWVGDVTLKLYDSELNLLDTQLIHQVPEPMTIALIGLGAMMLRRKRPV